MALCMQIYHPDGTEGLPPDAGGGFVGWAAWHFVRLSEAMEEELGSADPLPPPDKYVFTEKHQFIEEETNIWMSGGEPGIEYVFTIHKGTTWKCWRDR
jgi:hypothetical protein